MITQYIRSVNYFLQVQRLFDLNLLGRKVQEKFKIESINMVFLQVSFLLLSITSLSHYLR